jgi:hypothetical protein
VRARRLGGAGGALAALAAGGLRREAAEPELVQRVAQVGARVEYPGRGRHECASLAALARGLLRRGQRGQRGLRGLALASRLLVGLVRRHHAALHAAAEVVGASVVYLEGW